MRHRRIGTGSGVHRRQVNIGVGYALPEQCGHRVQQGRFAAARRSLKDNYGRARCRRMAVVVEWPFHEFPEQCHGVRASVDLPGNQIAYTLL